MPMYSELDRDVQKRVIRHMDIDSRRAINVYCRLKVPSELATRISKCLKAAEVTDYHHSVLYTHYVGNKYKIECHITRHYKDFLGGFEERYMTVAVGVNGYYGWTHVQ